MNRVCLGLAAFLVVSTVPPARAADGPAPRKPREALQAFNDLIGSWRGTGTAEGPRAKKPGGFWTETLAWDWQLKGEDVWLRCTFTKGKYFDRGELRYLADKDLVQLT